MIDEGVIIFNVGKRGAPSAGKTSTIIAAETIFAKYCTFTSPTVSAGEIFSVIENQGKKAAFYSLGDPSPHFGKTSALKSYYLEPTWQYMHYILGVSEYHNLINSTKYTQATIEASKTLQLTLDNWFQNEMDFIVGAARGNTTHAFWKNRIDNEKITWISKESFLPIPPILPNVQAKVNAFTARKVAAILKEALYPAFP